MGQGCMMGCMEDSEAADVGGDGGAAGTDAAGHLRVVDFMRHWHKETVGPEALAWVNKILEIMWPEMDKVAKTIVHDKITPRMQEIASQKANSLKDMHFSHFTLGKACPKVTGLHVSTTPFGGSKVRMMVDYVSDIRVELLAMKWKLGMQSFRLFGECAVLLRPKMEDYPGNVGGATMYFINRPKIELDFTGLANLADIGGVKKIVRQAMGDMFAEKMVLPNAITQVIGYDNFSVYPLVMGPPHPPIGALRVKLLRAEGIRDGDFNLNPFTKKVDDNYVRFIIGDHNWKAMIAKLPQERTFAIMDVMQLLSIEVWDEDQFTADDLLGSAGEYTMSEAQALDMKVIQVHDPTRKEGQGGILQMQVTWYDSRPFSLGEEENMVVMQIQEVLLHTRPEGKIAVRARLGEDVRMTRAGPLIKSDIRNKAVKSVLEDVKERLAKEGMKEEVIERVTAQEGLTALSDPGRVGINNNLSFPVATAALSNMALGIEIVQVLPKKVENVLGTYRHSLETFLTQPDREVDETLEINGPAGKIEVKASIFLCALVPGSPPEGGKLEPTPSLHTELVTSSQISSGNNSPRKDGGPSKPAASGGKWKLNPFSKS